jgi:hypothetical protein
MYKEIQYSFPALFKTPAFAVVAIATLALAIGANSAVLGLINALLIRPLPYRSPNQLVLLWEQFRAQGLERIPVSAPEYVEYENQVQSFAQIAAFNYESFNLSVGGNPERIQGAVVSPSLFDLLGITPLQGRSFSPNEVGAGHYDVVVISARLWERRFNSDPAVLGSKLLLNLGAQRHNVLALVIGHALKLVGIGTMVGLVLALLSTRALSALLYNVGAFDIATFVVVTFVLAAIALLASYIPALRATKADPMVALAHNA